jgi:hypothetical protein
MLTFSASSVLQVAASADAMFALIRLIEDPDRARAWLDEARRVLATAGADAAKLENDRRASEFDQRERSLADRTAALDARQAELEERARALDRESERLAEKSAKLRSLAV